MSHRHPYFKLLGIPLLLLLFIPGPSRAAGLVAGEADGTVRDPAAGLLWQARDDGQPRDWSAAGAYCDGLALGGRQDWRLPDRDELQSILVRKDTVPLVETDLFPGTKPLKYWTAERDPKFSNFTWTIGFGSGLAGLDDVGQRNLVRCVAGGGE